MYVWITIRHVFGQSAKKEYNFENIKVTNSAWDTNIVSASGVSYWHITKIRLY